MKRSLIALSGSAVFLVLVGASPLESQQVNGVWQLSPHSGSTRSGVATPPKEPVVVVAPGRHSVLPVQPVAFFVIPAVLLSDGTVLANFGFGFEPVTRSCGGHVVVSSQSTVMGSNGQVISRAQTLPQVSPQNVRTQSRYPMLTAASQSACFTSDQSGRFFVVRQ